MTTDEHFDGHCDGEVHGEVHGLLAGAFDDGVPAVNLVPGAVDGYRRHRRRARVLGAAGGTLALAGVVAAGTALAGTASGGSATGSSATGGAKGLGAAAGGSGQTGGDQTGAGGAGGGAGGGRGATGGTGLQCQGAYYRFGDSPGDGVFTADTEGLERVCGSDLSFLHSAIPDALISARTESFAQALARHDVPAGTPLPPGASKDTQLIVPGSYVVKAGGQTAYVTLTVAHHQGWGFNGCSVASCPPNLTLADGTPATENPGSAQVGIGAVSIHPDSVHWVYFMATAENTPKATLGFDFAKAIRSESFAKAVVYDVQTLNLLD